MSSISLPNDLANGQSGDATKVQENFVEIESYINSNAITKDGATALTGALSLVAASPTLDDHAARKKYVDDQDEAQVFVGVDVKRTAAQAVGSGVTALITFDGENADTDGYFTASSTNITIPAGRGGTYVACIKVGVAIAATITYNLLVNGVIVSSLLPSSTAPAWGFLPLLLVATDVVTVQVINAGGSSQNITVSTFRLARVSA